MKVLTIDSEVSRLGTVKIIAAQMEAEVNNNHKSLYIIMHNEDNKWSIVPGAIKKYNLSAADQDVIINAVKNNPDTRMKLLFV